MDCSSPGSTVSGILQSRILEWTAIPFSRGSSWPRDRAWVSCTSSLLFELQGSWCQVKFPNITPYSSCCASLVTQTVKASAYNEGDPGLIFGSGRSPGEGNGNRFQTLAWKIPWTKEPGRLQSMGSQRVRHDWATSLSLSLLIGKGRHSRFMPPKLCPKLVGFVGSFIAKGQGCF